MKQSVFRLLCAGLVMSLLALPAFFSAAAEGVQESPVPHAAGEENSFPDGRNGTVRLADRTAALPETAEQIRLEPFIPDSLQKVVIGTDDRVAVLKPETYPYSTVALIEAAGACGHSWTGTGFMIGENDLLTAAHCLFCPEHRMGAERAVFRFGYRNQRNCLVTYSGEWTAVVGTDFSSGYDSEAMSEDWCFVRFGENIGEETGWLGFSTPGDAELNSGFYTVPGYRDEEMKYSAGYAAAYDARLFTCTADTVRGYSGGPLLSEDYFAEGIIVAEDTNNQLNIGRRLTPELLLMMRQEGFGQD